MRLQLNNIGIIEEADIVIDGLTVIAGENDNGKSTVGKVLYAFIKTIRWSSNTEGSLSQEEFYKTKLDFYIEKLFNHQISSNGLITLQYDQKNFQVKILNEYCHSFDFPQEYKNSQSKVTSPIFIESPFIWNLIPSLKTIGQIENKIDVDFEILETVKDLYFALTTKLKESEKKIKLNIEPIINGNIVEDNLGEFSFRKENKNIKLINTAMGIKHFGILQVLADKNHLYKGQILILDEPEVHLHPKWQLELAKVIVELVSKGVKILVNSHSPYMIEALQRYSKKQNIANNFYLADENKIEEDEQALSKIFAKLSEPFDEFDKMDSEILNG